MGITWAELNKRIIDRANIKKIPVSGAFELTSRCNLRCKMCYVSKTQDDRKAMSRELTADEWIRLGREGRDAGLLFLLLTGGEVFLRDDFEKIYKTLAEMGFNLTIYTNGTMVTREKASWLGAIPPSRICITIYGASRETYKLVTGFEDGYDRAIRGLEALMAEGIKVEIRTTVIQGNHKDFDHISELAEKYNTGIGIVNYISPRREGSGSDPIGNRLSPEVLAEFDKKIYAYNQNTFKEQMKKGITKDHDVMSAIHKENHEDQAAVHQEYYPFQCQAGRSGFWLTWDGRLTPCGLLDIPAAKPLEIGFVQAWEQIKAGCERIPTCKVCSACSMREDCLACPARLMTETGSFEKPAPYLCSYTTNSKLQKAKS